MSENEVHDPNAILESLYEQYTKDTLVDESTSFPTVPTGKYTIQPDKRDVFPDGDTREKPVKALVGRQYASLSAAVQKDGRKLGRLFIKVSWVERRGEKGGLDKASQLWGQLMNAFNAKGKSAGAVLELALQYPFDVSVSEQYIDEAGVWHTVTTNEQRTAAREQGRNLVNVIQGISKTKTE